MSVRRGTALTITFPLIDSSNRPLRKAGVVFDSTMIYLVNPSFVVPPTILPTHLYAGRYQLQLSAAEMNYDWVHVMVEAPGCDPYDQMIGTSGHPSATAFSGGSGATFQTTLAESTTDYWKNNLLTFTTGANKDQVRRVTGYDGTTKAVTVDSAFTSAPSDGDRFILISI